MAEKKRVVRTVTESAEGMLAQTAPDKEYRPKSHMYLSLYDECCMETEGMELGEEVTLMVTGKITRMSETTGDMTDQSFDLDVSSVKCACEDE